MTQYNTPEDAKAVGVPETHGEMAKQEHGAQVHLTGAARAAARGALHGTIEENTRARDAEIGAGRAAPGTTPDGSTHDGRLPADVVDGADQQQYGAPGKGEGTLGARPGDEKVLKAQVEADAERAEAKKG